MLDLTTTRKHYHEEDTTFEKSTLKVSASESTPGLDDDDIDFKGFCTAQEINEDMPPLLDLLPPVESSPSEQLLSDDLIIEACSSG